MNQKMKVYLSLGVLSFLLLVATAWAQTNNPRNADGYVGYEPRDYDSSWIMGNWEFFHKPEDPKVFWNLENSNIISLEFFRNKTGTGGQALLRVKGNNTYSAYNLSFFRQHDGSLELHVFLGGWNIEFIVSDDFGKLVHKTGGAYFIKK